MDNLTKKYNDYMRLVNCTVVYTLNTGTIIRFSYKKENFVHLLGLHKLTDLQLIQFWLDKSNPSVKLGTLMKRIQSSTFTDKMVKSSVHYHKIQTRYENFNYDNLTTLHYTDVIVNFNPSLINSKLKSDYILFEEKSPGKYNHMGIALDSDNSYRYVETFFHETTDKYIAGQTIEKIKDFALYDKNNHLIVSDSFPIK